MKNSIVILAGILMFIAAAVESIPARRLTGEVGPDGTTIDGVREPFSMERINRALTTLLNGVRHGKLEEILRGSFMFTRNGNVRSVANNVISSVFGTPVRQEDAIAPLDQRLNGGLMNNNKVASAGGAVGSSNLG